MNNFIFKVLHLFTPCCKWNEVHFVHCIYFVNKKVHMEPTVRCPDHTVALLSCYRYAILFNLFNCVAVITNTK